MQKNTSYSVLWRVMQSWLWSVTHARRSSNGLGIFSWQSFRGELKLALFEAGLMSLRMAIVSPSGISEL